MRVDKVFIQELVDAITACDSLEVEYEGLLVWRINCKTTDSAEVKSAVVGADELTHLEKYHKELCESRGLVFDEDEGSSEDDE